MTTKLINCTTHIINILEPGKATPILVIHPSGMVVGLERQPIPKETIEIGHMGKTIPICGQTAPQLMTVSGNYTDTQGANLPPRKANTYYIVSGQVAMIAAQLGRDDFISPIKNYGGRQSGQVVKGCYGFYSY